jgi:hypothetical protein
MTQGIASSAGTERDLPRLRTEAPGEGNTLGISRELLVYDMFWRHTR